MPAPSPTGVDQNLPLDAAAQVTPRDALQRVCSGALLLDVRDADETAGGVAKGSTTLPLVDIAARFSAIEHDRKREILTICASGSRSLRALPILRALGYQNVASVTGGIERWIAYGLPLDAGVLNADALDRYSRHLLLPEVGVAGQVRLGQARAVLIGAGGLGSPVAMYLAAAGVGTLRLIDSDVVEKSNLQRQILHSDARIGQAKVESAHVALAALNPHIVVDAQRARLTSHNVEALLQGADIVIDGADNFATRYLLNAACVQLKIPLVYGAVHRFTGQVSVFDARRADSPCYRCLFPEPPAAQDAPNCAEAGVLGVLPGIIGLLQTSEVIKSILQIGVPLIGRLLCFDALAATFRELRLVRDPDCPGCGSQAKFAGYADIETLCASADGGQDNA